MKTMKRAVDVTGLTASGANDCDRWRETDDSTTNDIRRRIRALIRSGVRPILAIALVGCVVQSIQAEGLPPPDQGKFLGTGGFSQFEGTGGGGLAVWALITGYGTSDSYGANTHYTYIGTQDYKASSLGVAIGLFDRVELSYAKLELKGTAEAFNGDKATTDVFGVKVKLFGDAVYDQDRLVPQVSIGLQHKVSDGIHGLESLGIHYPTDIGAKSNNGTDYYIAATKILLAQNLLVNGAIRFTKANRFGLGGFGGDLNNSYQAQFEGTLAYLVTRKFAVGGEYRTMPHNLSIDGETNAWDLFVAWFPNKHFSVVASYADFGPILSTLNSTNQRGPYVSLQIGF